MSKTTITIKPGRGRDPTCGRVAFKTGVIKPKRQRSKIRGDKHYRKELKNQLET